MLKEDDFISKLLAKLPADVRETFSLPQLEALKMVLDVPQRKHSVDLRWQLGIWRWTFYFVFLFGRDRRELTRRQKVMKRLALTLILATFVMVSTLFGLLVLYLVKSALGINLFEHFSLGIWDWFKASFLQH